MLVIDRFTLVTAPRVCMHCYRRKEEDICARYKQAIEHVELGIMEMKADIRNESDFAIRNRLEEILSTFETERGDLVDERYAELNSFRCEQGVWGDG